MADRAQPAGSLSYDPVADLAVRHPSWTVRSADLGGLVPEVLCWARQIILLERHESPEVRRSSLAHAVAHLDLGHRRPPGRFFENREEVEADRLAARRLIPCAAMALALTWTQDPAEVAAELGVDLPMLRARERDLSPSERQWLRQVCRDTVASV